MLRCHSGAQFALPTRVRPCVRLWQLVRDAEKQRREASSKAALGLKPTASLDKLDGAASTDEPMQVGFGFGLGLGWV